MEESKRASMYIRIQSVRDGGDRINKNGYSKECRNR